MAQKKKKIKFVIIILVFIVYFIMAARPVPREIILAPRWISSLESIPLAGSILTENFLTTDGNPYINSHSAADPSHIQQLNLLPFVLGSRFGYVDSSGEFLINRMISHYIALSDNMWTEYGPEPVNIVINDILDGSQTVIDNAGGYPVLLDNRIFIFGSEQNSLSEIDSNGIKWTYEFGATLTCIDAAADLVVTGSLDGIVEVFSSDGERIFFFEPGGSRFSTIYGVSISRNGSHIGIISGIDQQRFLLLERSGNNGVEYKVIYHEFLGTGFRRPVRIMFIDEDQRIVFERMGGIGCYNIRSRRAMFIPLDGEISAMDNSGDRGFLFLITSHPNYTGSVDFHERKLIGIKFPPDRLFGLSRTAARDTIFLEAPFRSSNVFLGSFQTSGLRTSGSHVYSQASLLVTGGASALICFELEEK